ncbi:alpha/beta hydrolase family protein [Actinacidiphila paucisporea]|uniref:Dipeptidyl aminopeptidase/acylaminoacyl peptidase n=1 Tax=Actinacidiphila paucisporea TaxID=310782 RepID=A0A1M7P0U8_9ACTN|nr:prolyl oligopeptidase family serine peptidase [Actinacidiphila paucisporea]SHN10000.1 Dipeptidyl aminopeptidase/acylaminoacyl peptidase [Actinacidiphila paucisporea]
MRPAATPGATGSGTTTAAPGGRHARYRLFVPALPDPCAQDPAHMVFTADAGGRCEVFTWDAGTGQARQVTDRPLGTLRATIDPGSHVWWFDEDADGVGRWCFQPFAGGADRDGLTGVAAGTPRGLWVGDDGTVVMGIGYGDSTAVLRGVRGGPARQIARLERFASVSGAARSGGQLLVAVTGSARSADAVTVLRAEGEDPAEGTGGGDGAVRAVLPGTDGALWCRGFSVVPAPGGPQTELLLVRETGGGYQLAGWRPDTGLRAYAWSFDTEITARWYPAGPSARSVLVRQERHGRSLLHRADLDTGVLTRLQVPPGTLLDAAPRAGGDLHWLWTDTAHPPRAHSTAGTRLPPAGGEDVDTDGGEDGDSFGDVIPGTHRDLWTEGPGGPVHTWLSLPEQRGGTAPPVVFLVHGGPADHDRDAYDGVVHSLVGAGLAVARVNYRGSTGYGPRWRRAFESGVGLTQVEDLAAVRADLIGRGLVRPDAVALWGTSWGGYLTLLALGTRPGLWQAGVAVKPVADSVRAYRTTTGALRALDERLFGGTPDEVPEAYRRSSPLHYAARVRAPLLVIAATRDVKCPPGQVRGYLAALDAAGVRHESMWLDTGHDGYTGADHAALLRRAVLFLLRELRGPAAAPPAPSAERRKAADSPPARGPATSAPSRTTRARRAKE